MAHKGPDSQGPPATCRVKRFTPMLRPLSMGEENGGLTSQFRRLSLLMKLVVLAGVEVAILLIYLAIDLVR